MARKRQTKPAEDMTQAPPDARQHGLRAFHACRYDQAIAAWQAIAAPDVALRRALAEAFFRRSLSCEQPAARLDDMRQAVHYTPDDQRYQYHLALALHQTGDHAAARQHYRALLAEGAPWPGLGMVLALATLATEPDADLAALPGSNPALLEQLTPVQALLQAHALPLSDAARPDEQLWNGLVALAAKDTQARALLADERPLPTASISAVRQYYRGVAAAQAGDTDRALDCWYALASARSDAAPNALRDNLTALLVAALQTHLDAGNLDAAVQRAEQARALGLRQTALDSLLVTTFDQAAQQASAARTWPRAAVLWEQAAEVVRSNAALGSPRVLLHNLALAHEAQEHWHEAADAWRAMLRTQPRKAADSAESDGYSLVQWAWVRARMIGCYQRAGAAAEAVKVFRQAVKKDPHNLDMRLQLADALLANEQEQASFNELHRILHYDDRHAEAHLRLADIHSNAHQWEEAERALRVVLDQQPEREDVRRQVARMMFNQGDAYHTYNMLHQARRIFEAGMEFAPHNYLFPLHLARVLIEEGQIAKAEGYLERVLALADDDLSLYVGVIECWVVAQHIAQARAVLARAEEAAPPTIEFYVDLGRMLLIHVQPRRFSPLIAVRNDPTAGPPDAEQWRALAHEMLVRAVQLAPDDAHVYALIAAEVLSFDAVLALHHVEQAVALAPDDAGYLILLGLAQGLNKDDRTARLTLRKAARLARQQGAPDLARQADTLRGQIGTPLLRLSLGAPGHAGPLSPADLELYMDLLDAELDDDDEHYD